MNKYASIGAFIVGNILILVVGFVVVHHMLHPVANLWDWKLLAGIGIGGAVLAYFPRVLQTLQAAKPYLPSISIKRGGGE